MLEIEFSLRAADLDDINLILVADMAGRDNRSRELCGHFTNRDICFEAFAADCVNERDLRPFVLQLILPGRYIHRTKRCWRTECYIVGFSSRHRQPGDG